MTDRLPSLRPTAAAAGLALALLLAALPATAQHAFSWVIADRGSVNELNVTTAFHTDIINTGSVTDTYRITLAADMSANWLTTMCDAGLCYPPFITTLQYTVAPGDTLYVGVNITPMVDAGAGTSTVTVSSLGAPVLSQSAGFTVLTGGAEVLVVDADTVGGAPTTLVQGVAAGGRTVAVWDRGASGKLAAVELAPFAAVVWHGGENPFGLDADDRAALGDYLAGGGRVLAGGANLAFLSCDPQSAWYDPAAVAWFAGALGVGYAANASGTALVDGAAGDPVAGGFAFAVDGGGANAVPDVLTAQGGTACLRYAGGQVAGVRHQDGAAKSVYLGFGCAGITPEAVRVAFLDAALDWLATDASPAPALPTAWMPALSAAPNPFNPRTTVLIDAGDGPAGPGSLVVFDLRGRQVRTLREGTFPAGRSAVTWDGRDDEGRVLPGGPYVARLSLPGRPAATLKLMLAK